MPRTYVYFMVAFTLLLTGLLAAGFAIPPAFAWGFNFLRFLPPAEVLACFAAIAFALFMALHPSGTRFLEQTADQLDRSPFRFLAFALFAFAGAAFFFRISVPLLGDSFYIVKHYADVSRGTTSLDPRNEPLAAMFFYSLIGIAGKATYQSLLDGFFYGELLLGCGFIVMGYTLVRNLFDEKIPRVLALLFLLALPYMQLFFGYIETYALVLTALMLYSMTAVLVLRGKAPFALLALLVILHILVHYLTFLLIPSFGYVTLQVLRKRGWKEVSVGVVFMFAALVAVLAGVGWDIAKILPASPYRHYLTTSVDTDFGEAITSPYTLFSRYHVLDLFNYMVLLAMPSLILMIAPLVDKFPPMREFARTAFTFFVMAFLPIAAFIVVAKFDLGAARDWDVCASYFLLLAAASLLFVFGRGTHPATQRIATLFIMLSLIQSVLLFRVTGSNAPAIARYRSFFDERNTASMGWYTGSLYLAFYYHQIGDNHSAAGVWEEYAARFPSDPRSYKNVINTLSQMQSTGPEDVAPYYEHWIAARPYDNEPRRDYMTLLLDAGNDCVRAGKLEEALEFYRKGYKLDSLNIEMINNIGGILAQTGRQKEAIPYLLQAIRLNPNFANAHYNLANAYLEVGERGSAREHLRKAATLGSKEAAESLANDPEFADGRPLIP